ncbi:MAG: hypothetical protein U0N60_04425 [Oscillospiraceae bacterium]|nr:MAG TPA: Serine/Threonine protein kinase [Caudoviricetes sp.]
MSLDEGKSSSVVQNTSIASSPVGPMIISVIKATLSICSYAASLSAGVRLRRSTLYILLTASPPFKEIIPIAKNNYKEIGQTMRSKNFNDALKKAINGNWSLNEKQRPEPGYSVKLFQPTD